jgi:hypothetical protein
MSRRTLISLLAVAAAASAVIAFVVFRSPRPVVYDTPDQARFDAFLAEQPGHRESYAAFVAFLGEQRVGGVVPPWHLWRQGTDWRSVDEPPFAVPPRDQWAGMVPTLELLRDEVVPFTGPLEVVSGFRTETYNRKAGGAKGSRHQWFEGVDVVPVQSWERGALHAALVPWWKQRGAPKRVGLGLYEGVRFHLDTWKYRTW